jgi:3''-phosphoadenosine 5''-phosphosulfate sulfotransferase (PAPS reductase)/FAD synthetase and related enzymes
VSAAAEVDWEWLRRWREYFLAWYDEGGVDDKVNEAAEFSAKYLDEGVVSVSGGKDSMVMLHIIVNKCKREIDVFHWDHGSALMPRPIEAEIVRNILEVASGARRIIIKSFAKGFSERARAEWRDWYAAFFSTLKELGYRYHLLGIRADESVRRGARGRVVERRSWVEVHPIYHFTWRDVWAYVFRHNVPVPKVYFVYAKLLGWDKARLVTFFDREFEKYGSPQVDGVLMWRHRHAI